MKKTIVTVAALLALALANSASAGKAAPYFKGDIQEVLDRACNENKLLLISIGREICGRCQKFYALLGAHADYDFGPVVVTLWGRNLTNTHYNTFAVASSAAGGLHYFAQQANPIQLGMDVNIHF